MLSIRKTLTIYFRWQHNDMDDKGNDGKNLGDTGKDDKDMGDRRNKGKGMNGMRTDDNDNEDAGKDGIDTCKVKELILKAWLVQI